MNSSFEVEYVPSIAQPTGVTVQLFPHQLKSIEDMERLEQQHEIALTTGLFLETRVGLLSDMPGYGKTLSMLGLIDRSRHEEMPAQFVHEKVSSHPYVCLHRVEMHRMMRSTLVLVNVSLISQWMAELDRTTLRYTYVSKPSEVEDRDFVEFDVVLVSNNVYNVFASVFRKTCWKRFVIDEPASFKLCMEPSHARFYWLITGTPNELYLRRRTGFLNDLLPDQDSIDQFAYLILRNDDRLVKASYEMPQTHNVHYRCTDTIARLFDGLLPDHVIEKIEAYHITGVMADLMVDETQSCSLIEIFREKKRKRLEELRRESLSTSTDKRMQDRIQQLETHLSLFEERLAKYLCLHTCLACKQPVNHPTLMSCCQNIFCEACIQLWCPLCRSVEASRFPVHAEIVYDAKEEFPDEVSAVDRLPKVMQMMQLIGDARDKKILVFSNYNETFTLIKKSLDDAKLMYLELKGTKEKRDNTIDAYKTGQVNLLLLNTIHSGAGLNLQETTDIILFHRIHDYQKIQVIGRANRIGRKVPLHIHYLE